MCQDSLVLPDLMIEMIEVEDLTKYYGPIRGIEDVSFKVEEGGTVGLLDPNGAGKTTTMCILTCLFPSTRGKVKIAGLDVLENRPLNRLNALFK